MGMADMLVGWVTAGKLGSSTALHCKKELVEILKEGSPLVGDKKLAQTVLVFRVYLQSTDELKFEKEMY